VDNAFQHLGQAFSEVNARGTTPDRNKWRRRQPWMDAMAQAQRASLCWFASAPVESGTGDPTAARDPSQKHREGIRCRAERGAQAKTNESNDPLIANETHYKSNTKSRTRQSRPLAEVVTAWPWEHAPLPFAPTATGAHDHRGQASGKDTHTLTTGGPVRPQRTCANRAQAAETQDRQAHANRHPSIRHDPQEPASRSIRTPRIKRRINARRQNHPYCLRQD